MVVFRYLFVNMKWTKAEVAYHLSQLGACVLISQAISFARWNQWAPPGHFVNFHATLLAIAGVSLWCSILVIRSLTTRIEKLERVVANSVVTPEPPSGSAS